ncbi:Cytochrome P450 [Amanita muscaria]
MSSRGLGHSILSVCSMDRVALVTHDRRESRLQNCHYCKYKKHLSSVIHYPAHMASFYQEVLRPSYISLLASLYIGCRLIYRFAIWPKYFSPLRHLPTPPDSKLISGHTLTVLKDEKGTIVREWVNQYGPTLRIFGPFSAHNLAIVQPDHLEKVLYKDAHDYPKPDQLRKVLEIMFGYGLVAVAENEHRLMRKAMNPAFSMANLTSRTYVRSSVVNIFNDQIASLPEPSIGKVIHLYEYMSKATLDIICLTGFGYKADSLHNPHNELAEAYKGRTIAQSGANLAKLLYLMFIPGAMKLMRSSWMYEHRHWLSFTRFTDYFRILVECMYKISKISERLLQEKIDDSMSISDSEGKRDIMSILVRARKAELEKDPSAYSLSDAAMVDQVLTFLGAGHTATAIALTWALWSLAIDQNSQTRLREEVTPVVEANPHPEYGTLKGLQWLDCVVMETLRLFPPIPIDQRVAGKTDYIGDVLVPKGTVIYIPISAINTYKGTWGDDAAEFKPSRWLNLPKGYNPAFSSMAFLAGPHTCIGKTMALMEMKSMLALLVANFTFEPAYEGQVAKPKGGINMNFLDGMPLLVKKI